MSTKLKSIGVSLVGMAALVTLMIAAGRAPAEEKTLLSPKAPVADGPFKPDWESLKQYKCPDWFRDAKFGIWAHWSAQCVPEQGDWYAKHMYEEGSADYKYHVANYGHPSKVGFKDICNMWKAEKWEPEKLMELYKKAGAKYFVALANHHCNFDCWDSKFQEWNTVKVGPKKDLVGIWAEAARKNGLRFGVTVHCGRSWSWYEVAHGADKDGPMKGVPYDGNLKKEDGKGQWWDGLDPQELYVRAHEKGEKPDQAYVDKFYNRVKDLVDHYKPDLLYFDDSVLPLNGFSDTGLKIAAHYYNSSILWHGQNEAIMNTKGLNAEQRQCLIWDIERGKSDRLEPFVWQTDTCIGQWHYKRDIKYKTADQVVPTLIDIVSKNGNLLLNVPLKGDGTPDPDEITFLQDMAKWIDVNGDGIFATRPWVIFGEGAPEVAAGNFNEGKRTYTAADLRFTTKGDTIYAFTLGMPTDKVVIRSMARNSPLVQGEVGEITLLGSGKVEFSRGDDGLTIRMPEKKPCAYCVAFKITGLKTNASADTSNLPYVPKSIPAPPKARAAADGPAKTTPGQLVTQAADGTMKLEAATAELHGSKIRTETRNGQTNIGYWDIGKDYAAWKVKVTQAGTFDVTALVSAKTTPEFVVEVGAQQLTGKAKAAAEWGTYEKIAVGKAEIKEPGEVVIKIRPKDEATWKAINLTAVTLEKAK
jgi:alpha-L-fucosidase